MNDKLICIIGFMGSGKTAVADALSKLLERLCVDLDERIEDIEGRSPAQIITEDGEQAFREKETAVLRELLHRAQESVVALGGGAWTIAVNRELIRSVDSLVVWLDTPFDVCWQRIEQDAQLRPMAPSRAAAEGLFSERLAFYQMADLRIGFAGESPAQIAKEIATLLQ
ncbi:MAG TPA: shikimate kinase [Pyrinomonadaceae bacterium]|nr:shikimate kinase [Pyrinomonadaceae bacterium]